MPHAYRHEHLLYFFVARKAEVELCQDFTDEINRKLRIPIMGKTERFAKIFDFIMKLSKQKPITLVMDEFQNFFRVNKSIFSEMQRIWDLNKHDSHINLLVRGSLRSLMNKILEEYFRQLLMEKVFYTRIGYWHDRKGENEIDIVATNDLEKNATFYEVKRKACEVDVDTVKMKANVFLKATGQYSDYRISYSGLSMEDM